jgi:hypothetical protein
MGKPAPEGRENPYFGEDKFEAELLASIYKTLQRNKDA